MRVVFDTNIVVSALVFPGGRADAVLQRILDGGDTLVISQAIIDEVLAVLAGKFGRHLEELSRVAVLLSEAAEMVKPRRRLIVLADEPDNRILECALAGRADGVVTGDKAMLFLKSFQGIALLSLDKYLRASRL
jgi:putative PIN family toxin of toxin-antitoxin system